MDKCETSVASVTDHVLSGQGKSSQHSGGTEKFTNHYIVDTCYRNSFKMDHICVNVLLTE
jgi:hypothetical protein